MNKMKEITVNDIRELFSDDWIWVRAYDEHESIKIFTQSEINPEIPEQILALPVDHCYAQSGCGDFVIVCVISMQTLRL